MPNANAHKLGAGITTGIAIALLDNSSNNDHVLPVVASGLGFMLGTLPDIIEPALNNPNHRQFFHSYTFLGLVGVGLYKTYKWEPENKWQSLSRFVLLVAGGAYATHLLMDSTTPKGLPLI